MRIRKQQIDSFIEKFKIPVASWSRLTATLFLETQAGQAWVMLNVALGPHPAEHVPPQNYPKHLSPPGAVFSAVILKRLTM